MGTSGTHERHAASDAAARVYTDAIRGLKMNTPPQHPAPQDPTPPITRLSISCPDQPGIVAATSRLLTEAGANIVRSDQHTTDPRGGTFFMRMEFDLALNAQQRAEL